MYSNSGAPVWSSSECDSRMGAGRRAEVLIALGSDVRALTCSGRSTAEEPGHTNEGTLKQCSSGAAQSSFALGVFSFPPHLRALGDHSF